MGDVLSQNEIDNLLSALNSGEFDPDEAGETDDRQIKDYDFARPSKEIKIQSSQKSICERLNLFLSIMPDFFPQICQYIFVRTYRLK